MSGWISAIDRKALRELVILRSQLLAIVLVLACGIAGFVTMLSNLQALGFIDATRFGSSEGRARVLQAIDYAEKHDFVWDVIKGKYLLAVIEHKRGDNDAARARLREVLNLAAQHGHRNSIDDAESGLRLLDQGEALDLPG